MPIGGDYGSNMGTPRSNPASKSYAGSGTRNATTSQRSSGSPTNGRQQQVFAPPNQIPRSLQGLAGLKTGKTWYGNTAYGPANGLATGFSTLGPSGYGAFRGVGGGLLGHGPMGYGNPNSAFGQLAAAYNRLLPRGG